MAESLRDWLPSVIQATSPFISSRDIPKGKRGIPTITDRLESANIGIICLTPENLNQPWILFEAGALSKIKSALVLTYLTELTPNDIAPPLSQFQHTIAEKNDTKSLVRTINEEFGDNKLDDVRLDAAFDKWWPNFESKLKEIPAIGEGETTPPPRSDDSKLDEILGIVRTLKIPTVVSRNSPSEFTRIAEIALRAKPLVVPVLFPLANAKGRSDTALLEASLINAALEQGLIQSVNGKVFLTDLGSSVVDYYT